MKIRCFVVAFYTDMGEPLRFMDEEGREYPLGRYAAWGPIHRDKNEVIEVGDDLAELKQKYGEAPCYLIHGVPPDASGEQG